MPRVPLYQVGISYPVVSAGDVGTTQRGNNVVNGEFDVARLGIDTLCGDALRLMLLTAGYNRCNMDISSEFPKYGTRFDGWSEGTGGAGNAAQYA